jgi:glycosyltransferase involved in cell wall biosynthesis
MSKIPVAIVLNTFCIGGAELLISQFLEYEAENSNKFDYYVIELWPTDFISCGEMRKKFLSFSKVLSIDIKGRPVRSLIKLIFFFKKNQIQVIHSHFRVSSIISMILKILNPSMRLVITEHSMTNLNWALSLKSFLYAISLRLSDDVIAVSDESKRYILAQAPWKEKSIRLIHNSINLKPFLKILENRKNLTLERNKKIRLCVISRLVPEKNITHAIDVCNLILKSGNSVCLTIVGDGPSRRALEDYARRVAKFDIRFTGFSSDISQYLLENDGLLSMSVDESFSLVILEALISGIPCFGFENKAKNTFELCNPPLYMFPYKNILSIAYKVSEVLGKEKEKFNFDYVDCLQTAFDIKKHAKEMHNIYKSC